MGNTAFSDPETHRRLVASLEIEWDLAAAGLPPRLRGMVRRPGFAIVPDRRHLGAWVPAPVRAIHISERCIGEHPWYAVVDVLRHEMAHQIVDEVLLADDTPHGETFQRCCEALHANPRASGTYPTLDEAVLQGRATEDDRIMARVRKLLALSESPNQHEAESALAKARELMARYQVDVAAPAAEYVSIVLGEPSHRHSLEDHALASLILVHFSVRTIWIPMAVPATGRVGRALEIMGRRQNVQVAHYVHGVIRHTIDSEWARFRRGRPMGRNGRRDFALGMIAGFRGLLEKQERTSPEVAALVHAGDPGLEGYYDQRHPRRRTTSPGRTVLVNPELRRSGTAAAQRIGLHPGLTRADAPAAAPRQLPGAGPAAG